MRKYRISIVLEDADKSDYTKLTKELKKESFITIKRNEYAFEGNIPIVEIGLALSRVTQRIGKRPFYTVMKEKAIRN